MTNEDAAFRQYLEEHGFDTSRMGMFPTESIDARGDKVERIATDEKNSDLEA